MSLANLTASGHWAVMPSELLGYRPNSKRKSMSFSDTFVAVWSSGKLIVPEMRVFRCQSYVIQCILIIMKLSPVGLVQKSAMKPMSVLLATSSISLLMSSPNPWLRCSTGLVMLCSDILNHRGSHFLINSTNLGQVPICKDKFSTVHSLTGSPCNVSFQHSHAPYSPTHSFNVLHPCNRVSTPHNLAFLSSKLSQ